MQVGRELDEKVAQALGWEKAEQDGWWTDSEGFGKCPIFDFKPSTTWDGIGVLVEEAKKDRILIRIDSRITDFRSTVYVDGREAGNIYADTAARAVCLAFLKAKGITV